MTPRIGSDRRALYRTLLLSIADRSGQAIAAALSRRWRVLIVCGALSTIPCSGALASDPVARALTLIAQERYSEAEEVLDPLLDREPNAPGVRLVQGVFHARQGNYDEAIAIYENLRRDYPSMFEAHNNLAVLYAKLGRLDDALKAFKAALRLRPDAIVYANLGDLYMQFADLAYKRARELYVAETEALQESMEADTAPAPLAEPAEPSVPATAKSEAQDPIPGLQEPESVEAATPVSAPTSSRQCVRAGAFEDRASAAEAASWMESRGAEAAEVRQEEREVVKNYHVYLPPYPSRAAAVAQADELRRQGVSDIWIINEGTRANGISLGVYRNERYMRRRVAELEKLGYAVVSTPNMRIVIDYVVEASVGNDRAAFDDTWATTYRDHAISTVDCAKQN